MSGNVGHTCDTLSSTLSSSVIGSSTREDDEEEEEVVTEDFLLQKLATQVFIGSRLRNTTCSACRNSFRTFLFDIFIITLTRPCFIQSLFVLSPFRLG